MKTRSITIALLIIGCACASLNGATIHDHTSVASSGGQSQLSAADIRLIIREEFNRLEQDSKEAPCPNCSKQIITEPASTCSCIKPASEPIWPTQVSVDNHAVRTSSDFHTALAPHGTWIYVHPYGRVWRPTVSAANRAWRPYRDGGQWIWTDDGWYWHSTYSWGWAAFHYGRWSLSARHGWVWVPGTVWGPSWVSWRHSTTHFGWAPLPPEASFTMGIGLHFGSSGSNLDFHFGLSDSHYVFVPQARFLYHDLARACLSPRDTVHAYRHTSAVHRPYSSSKQTVVNTGISRHRVESASKHRFDSVQIVRKHSPSGTQTRTHARPTSGHSAKAPVPTSRPSGRSRVSSHTTSRSGAILSSLQKRRPESDSGHIERSTQKRPSQPTAARPTTAAQPKSKSSKSNTSSSSGRSSSLREIMKNKMKSRR